MLANNPACTDELTLLGVQGKRRWGCQPDHSIGTPLLSHGFGLLSGKVGFCPAAWAHPLVEGLRGLPVTSAELVLAGEVKGGLLGPRAGLKNALSERCSWR